MGNSSQERGGASISLQGKSLTNILAKEGLSVLVPEGKMESWGETKKVLTRRKRKGPDKNPCCKGV